MINEKRLTENFVELVSIDSPSFGERQIADYIKPQLLSLGFMVTEDDGGEKLGGNCGNIYGYLKGNLPGKPLLFCTHMDTVEPAIGKRAIVESDGTIHSDGTTVLGADDFAGIASLLEAFRTVTEKGLPHRSIEVLLTVAEEVYDRGAEVFDFVKIQAEEAYVLDYSGEAGSAAYAAPTILSFSLKIIGRAAHAGFAPEKGIHTIAVAAKAISNINMGHVDADTTANIGTITSGTAANIVPDCCVISGEIRSYRHERALEEWEHIKHVFSAAAAEMNAALKFEVRCAIHAYETPLSAPVIRHFQVACSSLGLPPKLTRTFGGSDNNLLAQHGIKGIVLACAMYDCHTRSEYTSVQELASTANLVVQLITANES